VLQCVAVCCSVLQCVAVCCSVAIRVEDMIACVTSDCVGCCSVLQCVAVCCSVSQCVAVCCSVLQCVAVGWDLIACPLIKAQYSLALFSLSGVMSQSPIQDMIVY